MRTPESIALQLASERHGVLTLARARQHGLTSRMIGRLVRRGILLRRGRGVCVAAGAPHTYEQDVAVAIGAAGGQAWASGPCAARLWGIGLPHFSRAPVEIVVRHGTRSVTDAARFAQVTRARRLGHLDVTTLRGLPLTSQLRTVVDCIGRIPDAALFALADDALWRGGQHATADLRAVLDRTRRNGSMAAIERILAPWEHAGPGPESPKEISLARVLVEGGLPLPQRQVEIREPTTGRVLGRADHAYPDARVAIEYLGQGDHGVRQAHGDALRDEDLQAVGWVAAYGRKGELDAPGDRIFVVRVAMLIASRTPPQTVLHQAAAAALDRANATSGTDGTDGTDGANGTDATDGADTTDGTATTDADTTDGTGGTDGTEATPTTATTHAPDDRQQAQARAGA